MDTVTLVVVLLIIGLCFVIYTVLKSAASPSTQAKSKEQKRAEIIEGCKRRMDAMLIPYIDDKETFRAKKTQLIRVFSDEFSRNVFFDADEVRDVIRELAHYEVKG